MVQSGNYVSQAQGATGTPDNSMEIAMAAKMQLVLEQPRCDAATYLVNQDYAGEFFKIGDTVSIIKPDLQSMVVELDSINTSDGQGGLKSDKRIGLSEVTFSKNILTIDKFAKYAFFISDITNAEGKWNYESGNLDLAAHNIRKEHNKNTLEMILNDVDVKSVSGTAAAPQAINDGETLYKQVIVPMYARLFENGAITADGQVTYGSNAQQGKMTKGAILVPTEVYTTLLTSEFVQDRSTVAADEAVKTGVIKTIMGLDIVLEPSLDATVATRQARPDFEQVSVTGLEASAGALCIIAGTRNCVTRAGKVLPPDKFRSHTRFGNEYHGLEIYAEEVIEPKAAVKAFITL